VAAAQLRKLAGEFGLTPSSGQRLSTAAPDRHNDDSQFK
jgi:phage terminase small subunit